MTFSSLPQQKNLQTISLSDIYTLYASVQK
jgi:hypothetical protein